MLPRNKGRGLLEFLLMKFESDYRGAWEEERFSVAQLPCETKHGKLDFDTIFYWKVYAQSYFAMRAGSFFSTLANRMGGGPGMIRYLASLSQNKDKLQLEFGRSKVLGYAADASQRLVNLCPQGNNSYVAHWLSLCLSDDKVWDGTWVSLVENLNNSVRPCLDRDKVIEMVLQVEAFVVNKLVLPPELHLKGVGPEVISFFLRDWKDFIAWPYFWKHDSRNEDFWRIVAEQSDFGLGNNHKEIVLAFLVPNLTFDEVKSGALAKINTAVYRIHKDLGDEGVKTALKQISLTAR